MKTLIHTNRIIVTTLLLVTAMFMPAMVWAQDNQLALTLVSSDANSFENQGPDKLVYGQAGTALMWCSKQEDENGNFVPFHIIVKTDKRTMLKSYDLYEYSYIDAYENADWKDWAIYGTNDDPASATAQWTEVHKVTEAQLFNGAWGRKHTFTIDNNTSAYTYYKVQITAVVGKTKYESSKLEYIQMMGHMVFYGETPNLCDNGEHLFGELTAAKAPTCTEAGNIAYHQCTECNKYFDEEGNELAEGEWVLPASHKLGELIPAKAPSCTEAGNIEYHQCTECNKYFDEEGNELAEGAWVLPAAHTFGSDDICTECGYKKLSLLSFTIEESLGGFNWEEPYNAIDGKPETKWCGNFSEGNPYIVLKNDGKVNLFHYYLYTGNDIFSGEHNRNPKEWKLYAKEKASDEWTVISNITDAQLPAEKSARSKDYTIAKEFQNTYYKFFKFEIIGVEEGDIYEVGELCLMGYPCHHQYDGESIFCSICGDIKKHEHIYTDYIVTKEPTCTEPGKKEHTCTRCEETETEEISPLGHTINDDLKCTVCGYEITADCIIEYTATERLSAIWEGWEYDGEYGDEAEFDYTDKDPDPTFSNYENFGEWLFGAPAIKHEYDETTHKGRIICNAPVTLFERFTGLHADRLISITLPSTVTEIGECAFEGCSNLTSITYLAEYSEGLDYWSAYEGCNNLKEIIVPYNSYHKYVEMYLDEDDEEYEDYYGYIKALFKSLLSLDDTKAFKTPENEVKVDATLQRTFADDGWYSLCLPFDVDATQTAEKFAQVAEFDEIVGDTYRFTTVDNIEAGKAYIVKVDAAVSNPTFKNVFITTETPASYGDFIGVYSPTELGAGCKVIGSGTTVNPANPGTMKAFRAYFPASAAGAKAMYFTVDDGVSTSIQSLTEAEGNKLKAEGAYNIAGQKVDENYRGIVIKNGKKYMNK